MSKTINHLPEEFHTNVQKKFFDATFDQVLSKKDSEHISGFIGRRVTTSYDPIRDYYVPQNSKERTQYQLEPVSFSLDSSNTKTNVMFYADMVDKIKAIGGLVGNQDRLFSNQQYSWSPPIDHDMFTNYQNYYWVPQGLHVIDMGDTPASDLIGKLSYTHNGVKISSGMHLGFNVDGVITTYIVEFMDGLGIQLTEISNTIYASSAFEFLPWDGTTTLADGRVLENSKWDNNTWDVQMRPGFSDYITIERGSLNKNAWSRTNRWYHIDTINEVCVATGRNFPANASPALRPIIQFECDIELYDYGTQFRAEINYGICTDINGNVLTKDDIFGRTVTELRELIGVTLKANDTIIILDGEDGNAFYQVEVNNNIVSLVNVPGLPSRPLPGDIVLFTNSIPRTGLNSRNALAGETWYYDRNYWKHTFNDKYSTNQPPLFNLYDYQQNSLSDSVKYPKSTFSGNSIFSYKKSLLVGASVDQVLGFPLVYSKGTQLSDIIFQNDLITDRYTYTDKFENIDGYYYYKKTRTGTLHNGWEIHANDFVNGNDFVRVPTETKQRVIDTYGAKPDYTSFRLSVIPDGYPTKTDVIVIVDGNIVKPITNNQPGYGFTEINNELFVDLSNYLTPAYFNNTTKVPIVEVQSYTTGQLLDEEMGYFQIPSNLESNPLQEEVGEIAMSSIINHFVSAISNQYGFTGNAFGANNYRDTLKNKSLGTKIVHNLSPMLKAMLVSSGPVLDLLDSITYSSDEYVKFKNRFITTASALMRTQFQPFATIDHNVDSFKWVNEIFKSINITKEYTKAFSLSTMLAVGDAYTVTTGKLENGVISLGKLYDIDNTNTHFLVYKDGVMLVSGVQYRIINSGNETILLSNYYDDGTELTIFNYTNAAPTYVPSTPAKLGLVEPVVPRIVLDSSYSIPTKVIIGHDGSRTIAYGDYRDDLLLELETRIYNSISQKFIDDYCPSMKIEDIKSGYFRYSRYKFAEFTSVMTPYLNKWATMNSANFRINEWAEHSQQVPVDQLWKLYNYSTVVNNDDQVLSLPGNWRGIYQYLYDTCRPNTAPWEMLGFSDKPHWWDITYGQPTINNGVEVWTSGYTLMWEDIEKGIIRSGRYAKLDSQRKPMSQVQYVRTGLSDLLPVDAEGNLVPIPELMDINMSGNPYAPFVGFDSDWECGDISPVEYAWQCSSEYQYVIQKIMFTLRPSEYGEHMWDTHGTEFVYVDGTNIGGQFIQTADSATLDSAHRMMRPKNGIQIVHGEVIDGVTYYKLGYQTWVSDYVMSFSRNVTTEFGDKVRSLGVNLGYKVGGFTNKDTTKAYIESTTLSQGTKSLGIPNENIDVILHKSQPKFAVPYSGVVIQATGKGEFAVYGYDLNATDFIVLGRSDAKLINLNIGGQPATYRFFSINTSYKVGDIVKYNGKFYASKVEQNPDKFIKDNWDGLARLPSVGGVTVNYRPEHNSRAFSVPYGTILTTVQDVFDFLIGYGDYLTSQGWVFDNPMPDTGAISDWLESGKQFLFWANTQWEEGSLLKLSPSARGVTYNPVFGYTNDVEMVSRGMYSILNKDGTAISTRSTTTDRIRGAINVKPIDDEGIYFLQVSSSETEHIMLFDNKTTFNDAIYVPLISERQSRIKINFSRSNDWYGKMSAPGYIISGDKMIPNFDNLVESIRFQYDPNVTIDDANAESLGRHLIGYESKSYIDDLQISDDTQYLFYRGFIRQKGTRMSLNKLYRSTFASENRISNVYEEWALKLGEFGNIVDNVRAEVIIKPEQNNGETIVTTLNYVASSVGGINSVSIVDAVTRFASTPSVNVSAPDLLTFTAVEYKAGVTYKYGTLVTYFDGPVQNVYSAKVTHKSDKFDPAMWERVRNALCYAVIDNNGYLSRIDVLDSGFGYTSAPTVSINGVEDKLVAFFRGDIVTDITADNIVSIDIDDNKLWVERPNEPVTSLVFPMADDDYKMPTAGYVSLADVTWTSFNAEQLVNEWGSIGFNPQVNDTVWVAKVDEQWGVFKLVQYQFEWYFSLEDGTVKLITSPDIQLGDSTINSQYSTDFGNFICIQSKVSGVVNPDSNFVVELDTKWTPYIDPDTGNNMRAYTLKYDGTELLDGDLIDMSLINTLLFFKSMRFPMIPAEYRIPSHIGPSDCMWVDNDGSGNWVVYKVYSKGSQWDAYPWDMPVIEFWGQSTEFVSNGAFGWDSNDPLGFVVHRRQSRLIKSDMFDNVQIFNSTGRMVSQLPVFDPVKCVLPGLIGQNVKYITNVDPARYSTSDKPSLVTTNVMFEESEVGQLWWDTTNSIYLEYEQPKARGETDTDILMYRRNTWGKMFPGARAEVYEWVRSSVPPSQYSEAGEVRDPNSFVAITKVNQYTNVEYITYYFWVRGRTSVPAIRNRTITSTEVESFINTPRSQGFSFFAPILQSEHSNSYMLYNAEDILMAKGNNVVFQFHKSNKLDASHAQWHLFSEGNPESKLPEVYWSKLIDSLCGYTDESDDGRGLKLPNGKFIRPVPDMSLSDRERRGVKSAPMQSMFVNLGEAKRIAVQVLNSMLEIHPVRDLSDDWEAIAVANAYWSYVNWVKDGHENAKPTLIVAKIQDAYDAISNGNLVDGQYVQVMNAIDNRFVIYQVLVTNGYGYLVEVIIQDATVKLSDAIFTEVNRYAVATSLRDILVSIRATLMKLVPQTENDFVSSMLNYVASEQKSPDWLFKTSYITVVDDGTELTKDAYFKRDNTDSIIEYLMDAKPYHTKLREYTSGYNLTEVVTGTVNDRTDMEITLYIDSSDYAPYSPGGWDTFKWDSIKWDEVLSSERFLNIRSFGGLGMTQTADQINGRDAWIDITNTYDASKIGKSKLYPYTFRLSTMGAITVPADMISITVDDVQLISGIDFFVEVDETGIYTAYFFNKQVGTIKAAFKLFGGFISRMLFKTHREESLFGSMRDALSISVETAYPVVMIEGKPHVLGSWDMNPWDSLLPTSEEGEAMLAIGGSLDVLWDAGKPGDELSFIDSLTASYVMYVGPRGETLISRASEDNIGTMTSSLEALQSTTTSNTGFTVADSPEITPNSIMRPTRKVHGSMWVGGYPITYRKVSTDGANWSILDLARNIGTEGKVDAGQRVVFNGTGAIDAGFKTTALNANTDKLVPDDSSGRDNAYGRIINVSSGGSWYAGNKYAKYIRQRPGKLIT